MNVLDNVGLAGQTLGAGFLQHPKTIPFTDGGTKPRAIWIGYRDLNASDINQEGCSEPLRAFSSKELADAWLMGGADGWGGGALKVLELQVL